MSTATVLFCDLVGSTAQRTALGDDAADRLALSLDKQEKYPEALKYANQAVQLTEGNQANSTLANLARNERDRLVQLTGGTPAPKPASAQNPPPKK